MVICCHAQAEYLAGFACLISVRTLFPQLAVRREPIDVALKWKMQSLVWDTLRCIFMETLKLNVMFFFSVARIKSITKHKRNPLPTIESTDTCFGEYSRLLGCGSVWTDTEWRECRSSFLPPTPESKSSKGGGENAWASGPEDGNSRLFRKFRNYIGPQVYKDMMSGLRKFGSSSTQLRESKIS